MGNLFSLFINVLLCSICGMPREGAHRVSLDHFQREKDEWGEGVDPERKELLNLKNNASPGLEHI